MTKSRGAGLVRQSAKRKLERSRPIVPNGQLRDMAMPRRGTKAAEDICPGADFGLPRKREKHLIDIGDLCEGAATCRSGPPAARRSVDDGRRDFNDASRCEGRVRSRAR